MAAIIAICGRRQRLRRRDRVFRDRTNPLDIYDDVKLYKKFRFRRQEILAIVDDVEPDIEVANRKGSMPAAMQVLLALRFYATGTFQDVVGDLFGVSPATVCRVVRRTTHSTQATCAELDRLPRPGRSRQTKGLFRNISGMPFVFDCVDGTLIPIEKPHINEHEFVCRKKFHAINVKVICNAELVFIDARVLRESALFRAFEQYPKPIEGVMLGDSGYMCRDWLFTPVTAQEQRFHDALTKTRCTVERAIGVAKKRFHCLKGLRMQPPRACNVIVVCFMLSNRARAVSLEEDESDFESDDDSDSDSSS